MVQSLWFCLFFVQRKCDVVCVFFVVCGGGSEEEEKIGVDYFFITPTINWRFCLLPAYEYIHCRLTLEIFGYLHIIPPWCVMARMDPMRTILLLQEK